MRKIFGKAFRSNVKAGVAFLGLIVLGVAVASYILSNQRLHPPAWVPVVGEDTFQLNAKLESAQGVLPGQGQAVNISGIRVGEIISVHLVDGRAVATMQIEDRFSHRIYPNATILLRPKTGLKDMVVELDPGSSSAGKPLADGATLADSATNPDVNIEEFFSSLDGDTQSYLKLLVGDAGRALDHGGGHDLANTLRRFQPLSRDFDKANRYVVLRRAKLKRVIHNFSAITVELGAHDRQLARFVGSSASVFRHFANQNQNLAQTVDLLPNALQSGNTALAKLDTLGRSMQRTFTDLQPTAKALGPTLRQARPFLSTTTPVLQKQLRPFAREVQPIAHELRPAAYDLAKSTPNLEKFTDVFNALFNELAYNPPGKGKGKEGYLFYLPWASHNTNSSISSQDGISPLRRSLIMLSCDQLQGLQIYLRVLQDPKTKTDLIDPKTGTKQTRNQYITTLVKLLNAPRYEDHCVKGGTP